MSLDYIGKKKHLQSLNENEFRRQLIMPLFGKDSKKMNPHDNHGPNEQGIDVYYFEMDSMDNMQCVGVQLKVGDISMGQKKKSHPVNELFPQIENAFNSEIDSAIPQGRYKISRLYIITTGSISDNAKTSLNNFTKSRNLTNNLGHIDADKLITMIDKIYPEYWSYVNKTLADFYEKLINKVSIIETVSKLGVQEKVKIQDIYVEMYLKSVDSSFNEMGDEISSGEEIKDLDLINKPGVKIISGESGSGKKMLVKFLVLEQIKRNQKREDGGLVPIILDAKNLEFVENVEDVKLCIRKEIIEYSGQFIADAIQETSNLNGYFIFIENLGKIHDKDRRRKIVDILMQIYCDNKKSMIIITQRSINSVDTSEIKEVEKYKISFFKQGQIVKLVSNWINNNLGKDITLESVVGQIVKNVNQGQLPRTPLVYTLNLVILQNGDKSQNLADLFDKYIDLYLGKWDEELGKKNAYEYRLKRTILGEIAYYMHHMKIDNIDQNRLFEIINSYALKIGREIDNFLLIEEIIFSGIIVNESYSYKFALFAIQEFFVGYHLKEKKMVSEILKHTNEPNWMQPIVFYAGLERECNEIILEILTSPNPENIYKYFYRSYLLSLIVSNADLSDHAFKLDAMRYSMLGHLEFLKHHAEKLKDIYGRVAELYSSIIVAEFLYYGMGSSKLDLQYKHLISDVETRIRNEANLDNILYRYYLSYLRFRFRLENSFEQYNENLKSNNVLVLGMMLVVSNERLEELDAASVDDGILNMTRDYVEKLKHMKTEIRRKLRNYSKEWNMLISNNKNSSSSVINKPEVMNFDSNPTKFIQEYETRKTMNITEKTIDISLN